MNTPQEEKDPAETDTAEEKNPGTDNSVFETDQPSELIKKLDPEEIAELPEDIKAQIPPGMGVVSIQTASYYEGPFPPPQMLRELNDINPVLAERVLAHGEREQEHRQEIQKGIMQGALEDQKASNAMLRTGQYLGFGIAITAIVCGSIVASLGQPAAGTCIGGIGLTTLVGLFTRKSPGNTKAETDD